MPEPIGVFRDHRVDKPDDATKDMARTSVERADRVDAPDAVEPNFATKDIPSPGDGVDASKPLPETVEPNFATKDIAGHADTDSPKPRDAARRRPRPPGSVRDHPPTSNTRRGREQRFGIGLRRVSAPVHSESRRGSARRSPRLATVISCTRHRNPVRDHLTESAVDQRIESLIGHRPRRRLDGGAGRGRTASRRRSRGRLLFPGLAANRLNPDPPRVIFGPTS